MTTLADHVTIVCPFWCVETTARHAADLVNQDGRCLHHGRTLRSATGRSSPCGCIPPTPGLPTLVGHNQGKGPLGGLESGVTAKSIRAQGPPFTPPR
jgi:hypothetical protein